MSSKIMHKAARFLWRSGLPKIVNYNSNIDFYGVKQVIPHRSNLGGRNLIPEELWMVDLFKQMPRLGEADFLDIGVNIGQTLLRFKAAFPHSRWIGFEPNPTCCFYLGELITENNLGRCDLIPVGLSNNTGIVKLLKIGKMDSRASIVDFHTSDQQANAVQSQFVPIYPLDEIIDVLNIERISGIKIDVEGAELQALEGMKNLLSKQRCPVICEILDAYDQSGLDNIQKRNDKLNALLNELQYSLFRIKKSGSLQEFLGLEPLETLQSRVMTQESNSSRDYVFLPAEQTDNYKYLFGD